MLDLTDLEIFVIDPINCSDADDAFNITCLDSAIILWLFVADPTREFTCNEFLKGDYIERATTKYYIDKSPIHLFSKEIVEKYSLNMGKKYAIGIKVIFDLELCVQRSEIHFVIIKIKKHDNYEDIVMCKTLIKGLEISTALFNARSGSGKILNDYVIALPLKVNDRWILYVPSDKANKLKNMIAEFAILANQIIAKEIEQSISINRICDYVDGSEPHIFLENIIRNEIRAEYSVENKNHMMIDNKKYTHFTSPLRRSSDCLIHYIIKGEKINIKDLENSCSIINQVTRLDKKRSYNEIKKYTFISMNNMKKPIIAKFRKISHNGMYLNMMMTEINKFNVQISISIKTKIYREDDIYLSINNINLNGKYDNEIITELGV